MKNKIKRMAIVFYSLTIALWVEARAMDSQSFDFDSTAIQRRAPTQAFDKSDIDVLTNDKILLDVKDWQDSPTDYLETSLSSYVMPSIKAGLNFASDFLDLAHRKPAIAGAVALVWATQITIVAADKAYCWGCWCGTRWSPACGTVPECPSYGYFAGQVWMNESDCVLPRNKPLWDACDSMCKNGTTGRCIAYLPAEKCGH